MNPTSWTEDVGAKRLFRARNKLNVPGIISHITQRASGTERTFQEEDDYLEMLRRLKRTAHAFDLELFSFVLMSNHVHLLVRQTKPNLHVAMRELFSRYARRYNKKYERKGHLFGGRYRQAVCLDEAYVLAVSLYIHLNPVRAGLTDHPTNYRWSSCRLFTKSDVTSSFVYPELILQWLSPDPQESRNIYQSMLREGIKLKLGEILEDSSVIHHFKGKLIRGISQMSGLKFFRKVVDHQPLDWQDLEECIVTFTQAEPVPIPRKREAKKYLVEQLISRGFTRREIARRLGISRKTIYNLLTRVTDR